MPILEVKNLRTHFYTKRGAVKAVDGIDVSLNQGDTLGIVGESGCGKTVLALSIMRLIASPPGRIVSGEILFNGVDLLRLSGEEMRARRGRDISMIFQEPMTSLNPVLRVGDQIAETISLHQHLPRKDALDRAVAMLKLAGLPSFERRIRDYPHQMSGGMRQRVMIAMALSCNPRLMLADEPTTALDVTIQAQIMELISALKEETGTSVIIITHDLGVIAEAAQFVAVMYAGRIVEYAPAAVLFAMPLHPYTRGLMNSIPRIDRDYGRDDYLEAIPGAVPALNDLPAGCPFHDRCPWVMETCRVNEPVLTEESHGHQVRCWKYH
ncbi:MAG: ABC transporter ATP-binding protein [Deltaproteobacteria bacterium]|nr:ABC transporter ATP-binding protein [Deltaproteobacteria bacterium]